MARRADYTARDYYSLIAGRVLETGFLRPEDPSAGWIRRLLEQRSGLLLGMAAFGDGVDHAYTCGYWMDCLARDRFYWPNTYSPSDTCWEKLMPNLTGTRLNRGVIFRSFSHSVRRDRLVSEKQEGLMTIQDEPLPIDRVRMVAPPELDRPLAQTLPVDPRCPSVCSLLLFL